MTSAQRENSLGDALDELEGLIRKRDIFKAKGLSTTLIRQHPSNPRILTLAAHTNILAGDINKAKEQAEQASSASGDNIKARFLLGYCYKNLGKYNEAIRVYGKVTERHPGDPVAHLFLADSLTRAGMKEDAIRSYRKAAETDKEGDIESIAEEQILKLKECV